MVKYYAIECTEEGSSVSEMSGPELEKRLADADDHMGRLEWSSTMPGHSDPNYWGGKSIIIKGEIVVPVAEEKVTVTKWKVP